jgi:hypothetical protein
MSKDESPLSGSIRLLTSSPCCPEPGVRKRGSRRRGEEWNRSTSQVSDRPNRDPSSLHLFTQTQILHNPTLPNTFVSTSLILVDCRPPNVSD